jgi:hypothetical protein
VFLPLKLETADFDGAVGVRNGLRLDARYNMASTEDALLSAEYFRQAIPDFHAVLQSLHVIPEGESVMLKLELTASELDAYLRPKEPAVPVTESKPAPIVPEGPRVVRIVGLDDGPHEIPVPAKVQPTKSQ